MHLVHFSIIRVNNNVLTMAKYCPDLLVFMRIQKVFHLSYIYHHAYPYIHFISTDLLLLLYKHTFIPTKENKNE